MKLELRKVGGQYQIFADGEFYCLVADRYGRNVKTRQMAEAVFERHKRAIADAEQDRLEYQAARRARVDAYLKARAERAADLGKQSALFAFNRDGDRVAVTIPQD